MTRLKKSVDWILPLEVFFVLVAFAIGAAAGVLAFHTPATKVRSVPDTRPLISNHANFGGVVANLDGAHPAGTGEYLKGFQCAAWSNGNKITDHGWIVYYCVK